MATALDVLSLDDAKDYLKVDFGDDDALITALIKTAVARVEAETSYRLYQRDEIILTNNFYYTAFQYPINTMAVEDNTSMGTGYTIQPTYGATRVNLFWGQGFACNDNYGCYFFNPDYYVLAGLNTVVYTLTLNVGYTGTALVPDDLITAIKQMIVFMYENRDLTKLTLPDNIMMLLNVYKRFSNLY